MKPARPARRLARLTEHRTLAFAVRLVLLVFCLVVAALDQHPRRAVAGALVVAAAALVAYLPVRAPTARRLLPTLEACIAAVGVIAPPADRNELLPYLLAPAFAAGLVDGLIPAVTAVGMSASVLMVGHLITHNPSPLHTFVADASQWVLLSLAVGLLASWIRRLVAQTAAGDVNQSYEAAYELLSQLRTVSRQLSEGLDAVSLAQGLLQSLRPVIGYQRAVVFVRSEGGRLVPLALEGASYADWDTSVDAATPLGLAWRSSRPVAGLGDLSGSVSSANGTGAARGHVVLPLRMANRTFGLVALETAEVPDPVLPAVAEQLVDDAALRLETALLFGEVRSIATSEERRRLAREIHDGIAQELASLGYAIDDVIAEAADDPARGTLRDLRAEVTRIVGELRLSIFDLRSEVQAQVGLGSALSDYVRAVSTGATFSVHVILDEGPDRLPITVEAELLRIAQEAITNARKHAHAEHLWVTCRVDPPFAHLRIEDDGRGLGPGRHDSFGLEVMRERSNRLGAVLSIGPRQPRGTVVDVRLGERRATPREPVDAPNPLGAVTSMPDVTVDEPRHEKGKHDGRDRAAR